MLPFLYRSRAILHLHSFPTRRSSDLDDTSEEVTRGRCRLEARYFFFGSREEFHRTEADGRSVIALHRPECQWPSDRKSTRLNSSHLGISYAVFCLKKKNTQSTEVTNR